MPNAGSIGEAESIVRNKAALCILCSDASGRLEREMKHACCYENKNIPVAKLNINGNLVLSSTGTGGEITEVLEPEKTGDDLIISFNRDYLLDAVKCIGTENLHIGFSGASTPAKFFGDSGQITVVPLRTN